MRAPTIAVPEDAIIKTVGILCILDQGMAGRACNAPSDTSARPFEQEQEDMDQDKTTRAKIKKPHAFFEKPHDVLTDPTLSTEQKKHVLGSLEQDARQLSTASSEGMTNGEPSRLHDVLATRDSLELPPLAHAYDVVLQDLRSRLTTNETGETRAMVEQALAALGALAPTSAAPTSGAGNPGSDAGGAPKPGSAADISDELAREQLDP
jgi:hypothetical protein